MDYFDNKKEIWEAATVISAKIINNKQTDLEIQIKEESNLIKISFPSKQLDYCGSKVDGRICTKESLNPNRGLFD